MADSFSTYAGNLAVNVVVGITNVLTILGSVLILVSYLCFPSLRTGARLILLHLSLMDLVVGLAHLVGTMYMYNHHNATSQLSQSGTFYFCRIQAFVGYYAIISSVLWTVCLSVYLHLLNERRPQMTSLLMKYYIWPSCAGCYGIPLLLTIWAELTGRLGYSPHDAAGWCTLNTYNNGHDDKFGSIFGFDFWIYLAMILITVFYISSHVHRRLHRDGYKPSAIDYKFVFIPIVFVFLRMWTCILDLLYYTDKAKGLTPKVALAFIFLTGIGDSAQGFTNAVLFVWFTRAVRDAFQKVLCPCCRRDKNTKNVSGYT